MPEKIFIYDRSGNLVNDPDKSVDQATGLFWSSYWPKGYGDLSFRVSRNIARDWAIKSAYEIIVRDNTKILYQGILDAPQKSLRGTKEDVTMHAAGYYSILTQRSIRKRWLDNVGVDDLIPDPSEYVKTDYAKLDLSTEDAVFAFRVSEENTDFAADYEYIVRYEGPENTSIFRVNYTVVFRTGEGVTIRIYNVDQGVDEISTTYTNPQATGVAETETDLFDFLQGDTNKFDLAFSFNFPENIDKDDYLVMRNLKVWFNFKNSVPSYRNDLIIRDVLDIVADEISSDYGFIATGGMFVGSTLVDDVDGGFTTLNDDYEFADSIIQRLAAYGDASGNTMGLSIWDETNTSDGKPIAVYEAKPSLVRNGRNFDWQVHLADLEDFTDEETLDELHNYVIVKYINESGRVIYVTPDTDSSLKDTDSIAAYGERHAPIIDAGKSSLAKATVLGTRYINYHKNPTRRTSFSIIGLIRNKSGILVPVNRVRAGDTILIVDYNPDELFFIRKTSYNAETRRLTIEPELPADDITQME